MKLIQKLEAYGVKGDIGELENIKHKVTRLVPDLKRADYAERLKNLRLTTL